MTLTAPGTRMQLAKEGYVVVRDVFDPSTDFAAIHAEWVAVTDADEENGCMQVVPRSHLQDLRFHPVGQPSGRPHFPSFLARSREHPELVFRDPAAWASLWYEARGALSRGDVPAFTRWHADAPFCA